MNPGDGNVQSSVSCTCRHLQTHQSPDLAAGGNYLGSFKITLMPGCHPRDYDFIGMWGPSQTLGFLKAPEYSNMDERWRTTGLGNLNTTGTSLMQASADSSPKYLLMFLTLKTLQVWG